MANFKINTLTIKNQKTGETVLGKIENVSYLSALPTATEDSADFVSVNNELYVKHINGTTYSYAKVGGDVSPITITDSLPGATEENFEKGKIYTQGELLNYIAKVALAEPNVSQANSLPVALYGTSAAAVGTDVYIFGGLGSSNNRVNTIYKYSTTTNVITTMSATLPRVLYNTSVAAVGTDIYIFGGRYGTGSSAATDTIYKYSTITDTITTMSATLPQVLYAASAATVGTDIYILGGYGKYAIYKYSTTTNTITTMSATLSRGFTSAAAVGTDIYIFGGVDSNASPGSGIYKYSTTTNTITTMSARFPVLLQDTSAAAVGSNIYIFGGKTNNYIVNTIYKYSTATNTITKMSATLSSLRGTSAAAVGSDVYIFGGSSNMNLDYNVVNRIYKVAFGFIYQYEKVATEEDLESKQDKLVSGTNIKTINNQSVVGSGNLTISSGLTKTEVQTLINNTIADDVNRIDTIEQNITTLNTNIANKQDTLTAGANIKIENNVISSNYEGVSVSVENDDTLVFTNINAALTEDY